jgi:hypothetical protein
MICPECKSDTKSTVEGSTLIISCEKCGWSIATTYIDPIYEDEKSYMLLMGQDAPISKEALKVVSTLVEVNFIQAKELLKSPGAKVLEGKAPEIKKAIEKLSSAGVPFRVHPDFPYI